MHTTMVYIVQFASRSVRSSVLILLASCNCNLNDINHCCVYSEKTPDDGQRTSPKHVEFYSKNKFEKLVHLFISVINQLDAQNFSFTISLFHASTCFELMCSKDVEA